MQRSDLPRAVSDASSHLAASASRKGKRLRAFTSATQRFTSTLVTERVKESRHGRDFAPRSSDRFVAAAYFAGDAASLYQLEHWVWSFERLAERLREDTGIDEPFGILCRSVSNAQKLATHTLLPVRFSRLTSGVDRFMEATDLRAVFYVNQATANFQALRYRRPAHVHLSHGESEKVSMISNQLKAYDHVFTAGRAARERLDRYLVGLSDDRFFDVGRPQLDQPSEVPEAWTRVSTGAEGPVVFFAPTWEGDSHAMAYGTLAESGEALVDGLLEAGMRVIYRPHPRTGWMDTAFGRADVAIRERIEWSPGSIVDVDSVLGWQYAVADACVAEMSSVAFDWVAGHKPLVMVAPSDPGAEIMKNGLFERVPTVSVDETARVAEIVAGELAGDASARLAEAADYYFGDTTPGAQQGRFEAAAREVVRRRERELRARA